MEEILLKRVLLRRRALEEVFVPARTQYEASGMDVSEARRVIHKLKDLIEKLDTEVKDYAAKSTLPQISLVEETLSIQIAVEGLCTDLESSLNMTPVHKPDEEVNIPTVKLPKLELPKFNGDQLRWSEFWDRFTTNIHEQKIAAADKLAYLIGCLEGVALEGIAGLTVSNSNYEVALETLKRRFGSSDTLIDAHYSAINKMPKAVYNVVNCRRTLDELERHLRILEKLGEPVNGNHLRATVLAKFPEKVIHEYHLTRSDQNRNDMLTVRQGLQKIIVAMESSAHDSATTSTHATEALHVRMERPVKRGRNHRLEFNPKRSSTPSQGKTSQHMNRKRKNDGNYSNAPSSKRPRLPCIFCSLRNHHSADCKRFQTIEARKKRLEGRCFRCLKRNHRIENCDSKVTCYRCGGEHLQLLCTKTGEKIQHVHSAHTETKCCVTDVKGVTYLQTAVARMQSPNNNRKIQTCRLVLDSGSQRSYITAKMASSLQLRPSNQDLLLVYTFGAVNPKEMSSPSTNVIITTKRGIQRQICVNIVPHITDRLPIAKVNYTDVDLLADDDTAGETIDLLIGNDYCTSFMRDSKIKIDEDLYILDSDFGYLLSGKTAHKEHTASSTLTVNTYCQCHISSCPYFTEPDLPLRNIDVKFLWSLENIGIVDSPKATKEEEAVQHFNETVQYREGRYHVKWPWIYYPPDLPINYGLALGRLKSVLKRTDEMSMREYSSILNEQLDLGIIEVVDLRTDKNDHPVHYLPHHMVKQQGKKGRIVYDASAKTVGQKSLNECLYSGPSMLEDLTALLIRFRTKRIGLLADVEKAFLQVALQEDDRDVTRFLWLKDIDKEPTEDNLLCLRFCRVPFGVISSPFLLTATIRYHLSHSNERLLEMIAEKCYVDNLVTGANSVQEAEQIFKQTRQAFNHLSMNIRDWVSNCEQVMELIPKTLHSDQIENAKVLGLDWNVKEDKLKLKVTTSHFSADTQVNTKRKVLRALARIYDPCGFVCPLILAMKLVFQNLCEMKVKWDTELSTDLTQSISETLEKMNIIMDIEIPRYIGTDSSETSVKYQLHCFTDASKNAYAAVAYLKVLNDGGDNVSFMMAKSRISQAKDKEDLKIPKLELLGFLIGSRLLKYLRQSLDLQIEREFLWTDSLVVLSWMRSSKLLPPFVSNRVKEIKQNHSHAEMCYIHTKENPADIATRPELFEEKGDLWFNGPEFLKQDESYWPKNRTYEAHRTYLSLGKGLGDPPGSHEANGEAMEDGALWEPMDGPGLTGEHTEITDTDVPMMEENVVESVIEIKKLQAEHFPDELSGKKTNLSRNLDLFLDIDGILRCRGRMSNTTWSYEMKYPILLPRNCEFTNSIIKKIHEENYHVGVSHTLNLTRERYWIPQGKPQVQKVIRKCPQCIKHGGGPYRLPPTPALPPERVTYNKPFTYTGVDYLGPLFVNTATGKGKRWVALFTCLTVRAIHLEIVKDLSAEECLLALRRFAASRAIPKKMYSDNATCFKLVSEVIQKPYCIENNITWKFIPELAPWHGGYYERLVSLVKHCLRRTLEKHLLNDSRLHTVIKEVEAILNTRPLTKIGTETTHVLRPVDFLSLGACLSMKPSAVQVPIEGTVTKRDLIESWKRGLKIIEEFKKMFSGQYLASLRERYNHAPKQPRVKSYRTPEVGDLVQIKSDLKNRQLWKVGKIDCLIKGSDGECRVAKVNVGDSILTRSIGHLYPLEVDETSPAIEAETENEHTGIVPPDTPEDLEEGNRCTETHADDNRTDVTNAEEVIVAEDDKPPPPENQQPEVEERCRRVAAIRAREKILEWTRHLFLVLK